MARRFGQYEDSMLEIKDKVDTVHHKLSHALKMTRHHASWIQELLDDSKKKIPSEL